MSISVKGLIAVLVWGGTFVATRVALRALDPFGLVAARLWLGAALLALILKSRGMALLPHRRDLPACIFLGLVLSSHLLVQAYGLRFTSAIHTGWIIGFIPVMIALGAYLLGQQRLDRIGWLGVAVGTAGILLVIMVKPSELRDALRGDLLQVVSCVTWTIYTLAAVKPTASSGVMRVTGFAIAVAAAVATCAIPWTGGRTGALDWHGWLAIAYLGPLSSGFAYYLWFKAVEEHGPARSGALIYIEPFVALATGAVLLGEQVTVNAVLGGLAVLAGVWLVARGSRKPAPVAESAGVL